MVARLLRGVARLPSRRATIKVDLSSRRMSGAPEGPGGMYGPRRRPMVIPQAAQDVVKAAHDHLDAISGIGFQTAPDGKTGVGGWLAHRSDASVPGSGPGNDWIDVVFRDPCDKTGASIEYVADFKPAGAALSHPPRILVLYGSLRETSFSRKLAFECARLLELMGGDVRVFNPRGLPVRDPAIEDHPKVQELRDLSLWSEGHVWVSPEMHGTITGVFKNQIDWLPLNTGSVRPTQGRCSAVLQVNGGSQSVSSSDVPSRSRPLTPPSLSLSLSRWQFNAVNELRRLARWMRMPCCTNQSSVAKAWQEFDDDGRMKESSFRDRVVDVMEEYYKFVVIMREHADYLVDRYSERKEVAAKGRLLTQAEKEKEKQKK